MTKSPRRRRTFAGILCTVVAVSTIGMAGSAQAAQSDNTVTAGASLTIGGGTIVVPNAWRTN